jgi:hypothetical protein
MDMTMSSIRPNRVEVVTSVQRRRRWTPEQKLEIVKQTTFASTGFELVTKRTRKREFFDEMNLVVTWTAVNQGQTVLLEQAKKVINFEIEEAIRLYREAYKSGDVDKLLDAHKALTAPTIRSDKINHLRPAPLQEQETPV